MQRKKKEATQAKAEDDLLAQKSEIAEQARKSAVAVRLLSLPPHHLASHCIGLLRPTDDFVLLFAFIDLAAFSHRLMLFSQL